MWVGVLTALAATVACRGIVGIDPSDVLEAVNGRHSGFAAYWPLPDASPMELGSRLVGAVRSAGADGEIGERLLLCLTLPVAWLLLELDALLRRVAEAAPRVVVTVSAVPNASDDGGALLVSSSVR